MTEPTARRALHVGVDARELLGQPTGVGRFLTGILRAWSAADPPHRVTLFLPGPAPAWTTTLGPRFAAAVAPASQAGTWWEQTRLPRLAARAGVDVLLSPGYTAPLRLGCPSVVVIHDVSFFAHPEWFRWREGARRRLITRASARKARSVVTVSEFSSSEIQRWLGVPAGRIRVIRHGGPARDGRRDASRGPLVLFVGSLFNRRRLPDMIAGFARALTTVPDATLLIVGDNRTSPPLDPLAIADGLGVRGRVEWRAYVPENELSGLYGAARVFLFLSDYEGFAMTPMEALAHGVPPVLLDTPVAREIYGPAARLVAPDPEAIGAALADLLVDDQARGRLVSEGARLLDTYTWARAGAELLTVLERAAETP